MRKIPFDPYFVAGVLSVVVLGGVFTLRSRGEAASAGPMVLEESVVARARGIGAHYAAGAGALQVVEITDLQCPACRAADSTLSPLLNTLTARGRINRTVFDAPLSNHQTAIPASVAAACAGESAPELRAAFRSRLYTRQAQWAEAYPPEAALLSIAHESGIDTAAVRRCVQEQGGELGKKYRDARALFTSAGLTYVPLYSVNGRIVPWTELEATLRKELGDAE
jgi:protein-disulfide isomerase